MFNFEAKWQADGLGGFEVVLDHPDSPLYPSMGLTAFGRADVPKFGLVVMNKQLEVGGCWETSPHHELVFDNFRELTEYAYVRLSIIDGKLSLASDQQRELPEDRSLGFFNYET